jgi:hypothetical protein
LAARQLLPCVAIGYVFIPWGIPVHWVVCPSIGFQIIGTSSRLELSGWVCSASSRRLGRARKDQ